MNPTNASFKPGGRFAVVLIALLVLPMLAVCLGSVHIPDRERSDAPEDDSFYILAFCLGTTTAVSSDSDLGDGTIRRVDTITNISPCWGERISYGTIYFKKCLQGQVYRSSTNDCRGAGNVSDLWGAQQLQFCPVSSYDSACLTFNPNTEIAPKGIDPTASPAAISCAGDTTGGKSWKLMGHAGTYYSPTDINLLAFNPDLPTGIANQFWTRFPVMPGFGCNGGPCLSNAYYFQADGTASSTRRARDAYAYVTCSTESY